MREVLGERHRRPLRDQCGSDLEAVVRIDAPRAGPRDRRAVVERQAGCVCEQMAERRAGRACGLVEVDDPLLGCDEHRDRRRELVTDAQGTAAPDRRPTRRRARDADGGVLTGHPSILAQRLHERRD
jgi:hypothetical protein